MENTDTISSRKWIWPAVAIIAVIIIMVGVSKQFKPAINQPVKIGVIIPLTGGAADYGQSVKKGVDLAVVRASKDYNVNLSVIYEDSQADPKLAVSATQKLINIDGVKYVVGFTSGEVLSMCQIADANKVLLLSPASSPAITTKCGDYTFRNIPADTYQGKELADKIYAKGYRKVAILYINNDYGTGLKDEFTKNFRGVITDTESHQPNDIDFRTQLTKIKSSQPEAIILITHMAEGTVILKQRKELGLGQPVYASETLKDPNLFKLDASLLGNLYINSISQYNGKEFQDYSHTYQQKYGAQFGAYSDYEYDNILTLASAIAKCHGGNDSACVKDEVYKTNIVGSTGLINFDSNGDRVNKDYTLYQVKGGNFVPAE